MKSTPNSELENANQKILELELAAKDKIAQLDKEANGNKELLDAINTVLEKLKNEGKIDEYIINHTEK